MHPVQLSPGFQSTGKSIFFVHGADLCGAPRRRAISREAIPLRERDVVLGVDRRAVPRDVVARAAKHRLRRHDHFFEGGRVCADVRRKGLDGAHEERSVSGVEVEGKVERALALTTRNRHARHARVPARAVVDPRGHARNFVLDATITRAQIQRGLDVEARGRRRSKGFVHRRKVKDAVRDLYIAPIDGQVRAHQKTRVKHCGVRPGAVLQPHARNARAVESRRRRRRRGRAHECAIA